MESNYTIEGEEEIEEDLLNKEKELINKLKEIQSLKNKKKINQLKKDGVVINLENTQYIELSYENYIKYKDLYKQYSKKYNFINCNLKSDDYGMFFKYNILKIIYKISLLFQDFNAYKIRIKNELIKYEYYINSNPLNTHLPTFINKKDFILLFNMLNINNISSNQDVINKVYQKTISEMMKMLITMDDVINNTIELIYNLNNKFNCEIKFPTVLIQI